jgi:hypothetical protein
VKAAARRYLRLDAYVQGTLNPESGARPAAPAAAAAPATATGAGGR